MATISEALAIAIQHCQAGRFQSAEQIFRQILHVEPAYAVAHNNLGNVLQEQGKLEDAVECYRRALQLKPDYALAQSNLGGALQAQGKWDEAMQCYQRTLQLTPNFAKAHNNLGTVFTAQGKLDEAVACYRRALQLNPDYAEAHYNLGIAFKDQGKLDEAIACCRQALALKPDYAEAHNNLGTAFKDQGQLEEAIACYYRALTLRPDYVEAHSNLGNAFKDQGKLEEAIACYRRALEVKPDFAEAHLNRALTWLLAGDWQQGWPEYEWRWWASGMSPRSFQEPLWDGNPLTGEAILLHAEQGLGDTIQFIRYALLVKRLGAAVVVECQKALLPLLSTCAGIDHLVARGDAIPAFTAQAPLLSLPRIFQTSPDAIPAAVPYLFAAPARVESWRQRLRDLPGYKIGINWHGRPGHGSWRARNIPLQQFAPLAEIPGVRLISLQKGAGREEMAAAGGRLPLVDLGDEVDQAGGAFMDTAAIMMNLDLVITSDTAVPNLAGALGVPVWVALPRVPDWRWLLDRSDSRWYPTMRLFRQKTSGDWAAVFEEIRAALCERLNSPHGLEHQNSLEHSHGA
jgi:tetratricopeptide (TPR) repeat protein